MFESKKIIIRRCVSVLQAVAILAATIVLPIVFFSVVNPLIDTARQDAGLPSYGSILSEQVVESHPVASVTQTDENGTATYRVIEQVDGADVANTYSASMKGLEVREADELGQRVDKVSVERTDLFCNVKSEEYRLYVDEGREQ